MSQSDRAAPPAAVAYAAAMERHRRGPRAGRARDARAAPSASEVLARARRSRARARAASACARRSCCSPPSCAATPVRVAIQVAAAVELLHTATLLHDDVVDLSELRRGRPSANALWGNRRAVLAGDFFYARASSMIVEDGDLDILWIFADTIRSMAEGELLQLQRSFDPSRHRGALLPGDRAQERGAVVRSVRVGRDPRRCDARRAAPARRVRPRARARVPAARRRARLRGSRGRVSASARTRDLREGKVTLPLLLALKRCSAAEREAVGSLLKAVSRSADPDAADAQLDLSSAIEIVRRYRGVVDTVRRAEEHARRARTAIAPFPDGGAQSDLLAAAEFAVTRDR